MRLIIIGNLIAAIGVVISIAIGAYNVGVTVNAVNNLNSRFDRVEVRLDRMENTINDIQVFVKDHERRITKLESK